MRATESGTRFQFRQPSWRIGQLAMVAVRSRALWQEMSDVKNSQRTERNGTRAVSEPWLGSLRVPFRAESTVVARMHRMR